MFFIRILFQLTIFVITNEIDGVKVPCQYRCHAIINLDGHEPEPAIVNETNFSSLVLCLKLARIEKTQVAGFMNEIKPMVLYANGH